MYLHIKITYKTNCLCCVPYEDDFIVPYTQAWVEPSLVLRGTCLKETLIIGSNDHWGDTIQGQSKCDNQ
jgi:hypothetical protein